MKPIKEWFESIKNAEIRKAALQYVDCPGRKVATLYQALLRGFVWSATHEGRRYWHYIAYRSTTEKL